MAADDPRGREIFEGVLAAGYDYFETQLSNLPTLSPAQYAEFKSRLADAGVPCRANLLLFPGDMTLVGNDRNLYRMVEHAKRVLPIAADLGSELVVFGNGGNRRIPAGLTRETVRRQLIDALQMVNPIAASYQLKVAIEPLNTRETDIINSFPEAVGMAEECGHCTGAVFDLYHCMAEGQSPGNIADAPEKLFHLHIAYPPARTVPAETDEDTDYLTFARAIKTCGYDDKMSVEGGIPAGADAAAAIAEGLKVLRRYFA